MQLTFLPNEAVPNISGQVDPFVGIGPKPWWFHRANVQEVSTALHKFTEDNGMAVLFYAPSLLQMPLAFEW